MSRRPTVPPTDPEDWIVWDIRERYRPLRKRLYAVDPAAVAELDALLVSLVRGLRVALSAHEAVTELRAELEEAGVLEPVFGEPPRSQKGRAA